MNTNTEKKINLKRPNNPIGETLIALRKQKGWTQEDLAKALGVTRRTIDYYERQAQNISLFFAEKLSRIFNIKLDQFLNNNKIKLSNDIKAPKKIRKFFDLSKENQKIILKMINSLALQEKLEN